MKKQSGRSLTRNMGKGQKDSTPSSEDWKDNETRMLLPQYVLINKIWQRVV